MSHKNTKPAVNTCLLHKTCNKQIDNTWKWTQENHENRNIQEDHLIVFINWFFGWIIDQLISEIQTGSMISSLVSFKKLFIAVTNWSNYCFEVDQLFWLITTFTFGFSLWNWAALSSSSWSFQEWSGFITNVGMIIVLLTRIPLPR